MKDSNIKIFPDAESLAERAVTEFLRRASAAIANNARFTVVLSGGSTPILLYRCLVKKVCTTPEYQDIIRQVHYFWGDERDVRPDDSESNFGSANLEFLSKLAVPEAQIHRIKPEVNGASPAADDYEAEIQNFFQLKTGEFPHFDLVFLGMGEDGHTASLFPGSIALDERQRLVVAPFVEKLNGYRITLTFPVFNHARRIIILVAGAAKTPALSRVFEESAQPVIYPVQSINPHDGELLWYIDRAAHNGDDESL